MHKFEDSQLVFSSRQFLKERGRPTIAASSLFSCSLPSVFSLPLLDHEAKQFRQFLSSLHFLHFKYPLNTEGVLDFFDCKTILSLHNRCFKIREPLSVFWSRTEAHKSRQLLWAFFATPATRTLSATKSLYHTALFLANQSDCFFATHIILYRRSSLHTTYCACQGKKQINGTPSFLSFFPTT